MSSPTPEPRFTAGDKVVDSNSREAVGEIISARRMSAEFWYRVGFGNQVRNIREADLDFAEELQDIRSLLCSGRFGGHEAFARRLTMSKLQRPLREAIYAMEASRTEFHPYQFRPLLKLLASDQPRILIADEVGLGKTIEAGYIIQEQRARHDIERILIVCPSALRRKWQMELDSRFGEDFEILDASTFRAKAFAGEDGSKSRKRLQAIVSFHSVRHESTLKLLESQPCQFDLLIVDEAHHLRNSETRQHRAVESLAFESEAAIFLSATPLHTGNENLFQLLRLLRPDEFDVLAVFENRILVNQFIVQAEALLRQGTADGARSALEILQRVEMTWERERFQNSALYQDIKSRLDKCDGTDRREIVELQEALSRLNLLAGVMTRTKKRDVYKNAAKREAQVVEIAMTDAERLAYEEFTEFCYSWFTKNKGDFAARFASITLQRQLASSICATLEHYADAVRLHRPDLLHDDIDSYDSSEEEDDQNDGEDDASYTPRLIDDPEFARLVTRHAGPALRRDSKFEQLCQVLDDQVTRKHDKVLVFSYFKKSLRYLESRLTERGIKCVRIDGDVKNNPRNPDEDERYQRIRKFREDPEVSVLLSSEVGSEGLDFQFCHTLVNWDLPWNPMVVEQRIGRLDRLGQKSPKILIFNLSFSDTIEDRILNRLYTRVGIFEGVIGPLEPILGKRIKQLTEQLFNAQLTPDERDQLIDSEALILEKQLLHQRELEDKASALIGYDEAMQQEVDKVRRLGRYVTAEETNIFLYDFLINHYEEASLRDRRDGPRGRDAGTGCWWMRTSPALMEFVRRMLPITDAAGTDFRSRASNIDLRVTFDNAVAREDRTVEYIHAQHPLLRAVKKFYESSPERIHPVSALAVKCSDVPPNDYLYMWVRVKETGLREGESLWAVCAAFDGGLHISGETAELLLYRMLVDGKPWAAFSNPGSSISESLFDQCEERIVDRVNARQSEADRRNAAMIDARVASLRASFNAKKASKEKILEAHRARGTQSMIRMVEGQMRKLQADFDAHLERLEQKGQVRLSYVIEGAGYVRVENPSPS